LAAIALVKGRKVPANGKVSGTPSILRFVRVTKRNQAALQGRLLKRSQVAQPAKYCT
jgi:hypothetical protein